MIPPEFAAAMVEHVWDKMSKRWRRWIQPDSLDDTKEFKFDERYRMLKDDWGYIPLIVNKRYFVQIYHEPTPPPSPVNPGPDGGGSFVHNVPVTSYKASQSFFRDTASLRYAAPSHARLGEEGPHPERQLGLEESVHMVPEADGVHGRPE